MDEQLTMPLKPNNTFPASKYDGVMRDLLLKQASGQVFLPGEPIWGSSNAAGWAETCTIVASPTTAILKPEALNDFMFSLTDVPYSSVDRTYRHGEDCDLPIPKLYFDEELAQIHRTIHAHVNQILAFKTDLRLDAPPKKETTEMVRRRTWLYAYPDPTSAEIAQKIMTGEYEADLTTFSQYHLSPKQVEMIRRGNRRNIIRKIVGR